MILLQLFEARAEFDRGAQFGQALAQNRFDSRLVQGVGFGPTESAERLHRKIEQQIA